MSLALPHRHRGTHESPSWTGMALVVESMVLLLFLVASIALVTEAFLAAAVQGRQGRELAQAVAAATNAAERFAADPAAAEGSFGEGELTVTCNVTSEPTGTGTLYHAAISVCFPGHEQPLYELATARFTREVS